MSQPALNPAAPLAHRYVRRDGQPMDDLTAKQAQLEAPTIGGYAVEGAELRTWRPLPPRVARRLKLRIVR